MQPSRLGIVLAGLLLCLAKPASAGVLTITMIDNGSSISVSMSGSLEFSSAGFASSNGFPNYIAPENGTIGFGPSGTLTQEWSMLSPTYPLNVTSTSPVQSRASVFSPYGSGPYAAGSITNVSGSTFFVYTGAIAVAPDYSSGTQMSATGTISGNFTTRGITVGTSTTVFRLGNVTGGAENTLIVQRSVAPASVPDQMPTAALGAGVVLMGLAARRRRR